MSLMHRYILKYNTGKNINEKGELNVFYTVFMIAYAEFDAWRGFL